MLIEDGHEENQLNGHHRINYDADTNYWKVYYRLKESDLWEVVHRFKMVPAQKLSDFQPTCDDYQFGRDPDATSLFSIPTALRRVINQMKNYLFKCSIYVGYSIN